MSPSVVHLSDALESWLSREIPYLGEHAFTTNSHILDSKVRPYGHGVPFIKTLTKIAPPEACLSYGPVAQEADLEPLLFGSSRRSSYPRATSCVWGAVIPRDQIITDSVCSVGRSASSCQYQQGSTFRTRTHIGRGKLSRSLESQTQRKTFGRDNMPELSPSRWHTQLRGT